MTPERWKRINDLFQSALERSPKEREALLRVACGADDALRAEVESLLLAHDQAGTFIDATAYGSGSESADSPATAEVLAPGRRLGPYEVLGLVGAGGMGQVYRARDPRLSRDVAIKVVSRPARSPGESRQLQREARAAAALTHPNILAVYDVGAEGPVAYVVSELLEGATLRERLRSGPLPRRECLDYARQIAAGLAAAHDEGIVHRDLKPENLFVTRHRWVKILDFGLAKRTVLSTEGAEPGASAAATASRSEPGVLLGTVGYMSPEQVRGRPADPRSDVFSFGAVLYEMLSGSRAFAADSPVETMSAILTESPPGIDGIPAGIQAVVRRCLEKEPENRFASGRELALVLETGDLEREAPPAPEPREPKPPRHSIAVLPFMDMSVEKDQDYFCEGIAEELTSALGKVEGLRVVGRASAFRFKGQTGNLRRIGADLGVDKVLDGSIRKAGRRLRITVQLVNVADGFHHWSERYDRDAEDIFAVQDEITARVVEALRLTLDPRRARARRYTDDLEAYHLYLKGLYFWNKRHQGGLEQGRIAFEQAIDHDPSYALAYAGLADSYALLGFELYDVLPGRESCAKAKAAAHQALEIDPSLAGPHSALGWVRFHNDWDWAAAEADFQQALVLDPDRATTHHWYAYYLTVVGRSREAEREARRAWELEPLSLVINQQICQTFYYAGRFEETAEVSRKVLAMDPGFPLAHYWLGVARAAQERYDEAIAEYEAFALGVGGSTRALALVGNARARAGDHAGARQVLQELAATAVRRHVPSYHRALVHIGLGERDLAFAWLEKAYDERSDQLAYLGIEPLFDPLRSDPRFDALVRRLELPYASLAASSSPAPAPRRSVAVLPFRDFAGDSGTAHLGLALADATINELAQLKSLLVRPTSAILRYLEQPTSPQQAARELGVEAVVEGGIQRDGSRLRVSVQLVGAADGRSLWAKKVETSLDDAFQMQDEVSRSIANALAIELTPADQNLLARRALAPRPTTEAYELYLKGKLHLFRETLSDFVAAVDWFDKAREADPGFALAWAGLADAYARISFSFHPEGDWYVRAQAICEKGLALDPGSPEALYVRARLRWSPQGGFDHAGAIRDLVKALRGRPSLDEAHIRLSVILNHIGFVDEGLAHVAEALAISPEHVLAQLHVGLGRYHQGRYEEALALTEDGARRAPASFAIYQTGLCQLRLGRSRDAAATAQALTIQYPNDVLASPLLGLLAAVAGDAEEALRQVLLTAENKRGYGHYHHAQYDVACIYALLGRTDEALDGLEKAARNGYPCWSFFERDGFLASVRGDERFRRFLDELKLECEGLLTHYREGST
jgi:serine/threonine-protein kinase